MRQLPYLYKSNQIIVPYYKIVQTICLSLTALGLGFSIFFGDVSTIRAQGVSSQSVKVEPSSTEVETSPGQNITLKANIFNLSPDNIKVGVRINGLDPLPANFSDWSKVDPSVFTLSPGQNQTVTAKIFVPESTTAQRYGAIVFSYNKEGQDVYQTKELSSLFLLKMSAVVTPTPSPSPTAALTSNSSQSSTKSLIAIPVIGFVILLVLWSLKKKVAKSRKSPLKHL